MINNIDIAHFNIRYNFFNLWYFYTELICDIPSIAKIFDAISNGIIAQIAQEYEYNFINVCQIFIKIYSNVFAKIVNKKSEILNCETLFLTLNLKKNKVILIYKINFITNSIPILYFY